MKLTDEQQRKLNLALYAKRVTHIDCSANVEAVYGIVEQLMQEAYERGYKQSIEDGKAVSKYGAK